MLSIPLFAFLALVLIPVLAVQVPLTSHDHLQDEDRVIFGGKDFAVWNLEKLPSPDDTDHLVFETVHSLLQHWPNTRMRNGHNIVPGIIPKGTLLYHGRSDNEVPLGLEWTATDPEHAHIFCMDPPNQNLRQTCWLMTLATTRTLKVVYFDGSSAANLPSGGMDTQEPIAWGRPEAGDRRNELGMIQDLCKWGANFGVDGFVRMEMDFEIVLCNFASSVSLVSSVNLASRGRLRAYEAGFITFGVIDAGSWHNHFPGETPVQLDLAGLVSFYDTQLVPSLVAIRAGQERWDHRIQNTSSEDLLAVKSRLEAALIRPLSPSSGIDWRTLFQLIVDRFAGRLELTRHLLNSSATDPDEIMDLANHAQSQLRIMLTPYLLFSATPANPSDKADMSWTMPIYNLCATTNTGFIESMLDSMTDSEKLLLRAARGTTREICRVVTKMWGAGVYAGIDPLLNTKESPDVVEVTKVRSKWTEDLNRLMAWLDWYVWVKCNPGCGPEEMCYLPTWPLGFPLMHRGRKPPSPSYPDQSQPEGPSSFHLRTIVINSLAEEGDVTMAELDEYVRPQPKCVRRLPPQDFLNE